MLARPEGGGARGGLSPTVNGNARDNARLPHPLGNPTAERHATARVDDALGATTAEAPGEGGLGTNHLKARHHGPPALPVPEPPGRIRDAMSGGQGFVAGGSK